MQRPWILKDSSSSDFMPSKRLQRESPGVLCSWWEEKPWTGSPKCTRLLSRVLNIYIIQPSTGKHLESGLPTHSLPMLVMPNAYHWLGIGLWMGLYQKSVTLSGECAASFRWCLWYVSWYSQTARWLDTIYKDDLCRHAHTSRPCGLTDGLLQTSSYFCPLCVSQWRDRHTSVGGKERLFMSETGLAGGWGMRKWCLFPRSPACASPCDNPLSTCGTSFPKPLSCDLCFLWCLLLQAVFCVCL